LVYGIGEKFLEKLAITQFLGLFRAD